jgi:PAS domain S-box-containing protein
MNYQSLSQLELIRVLEAHEQMRISLQARVDTLEDNARLVANLQLHRLELEAQNRTLREAQGQLEESRSRYADLYDFAPIAYCTFDRNGIVLEINLRGASLLGHERGQIVGKPLLSMLKVRDPLEFSRFLRHSIASDVPVTGELHVIDTRGEVALQLLGAAPLSAPGTCRAALIDVTAEREAERASEVHHRAEKALRMRIEAIDGASAAVNRALITCEGGDIRAFLQVVADEARALTQAEYAALGIGGSDGGVFEPWVYSGTAPHHAALSESPPHATGLLAVPRMRHPVQFRDTRAAGTPPVIDTHRLTSFVSVPILCGDARQGSIYLANKLDGSAFSDDDQVLIEMLAERVGSAMEVAQLRREELRAHLRLELLARAGPLLAESIDLEATLAAIAKLLVPLAADMSALDLLEADGSTRRLAVYPPDPAHN